MSEIDIIKARLSLIRIAINEIIQSGQEVSISGAVSARRAELERLVQEESRLKKRLARLLGYSGKVRRVSDE